MIFLKLFWKEIGIGLIILACAITVGITHAQLKSCRADNELKQSQIVFLSNSINLQNESIRKLGDATKEAQNKAIQAIKKSKVISAQAESNKTRLSELNLHSSASSCEVQIDDVKKLLESAR